MSRLLAGFGRLCVILLGLVLAWASASLFLHLLVYGGVVLEEAAEAGGPTMGIWVFAILFGTLALGRLTLWFALIGVLAAEFLGRRDWLFFSLAGAAVSLTAFGYHRWDAYGTGFDGPSMIAALVGAGLVAGIAYWAVAGRGSGLWLKPTAPGPSGS